MPRPLNIWGPGVHQDTRDFNQDTVDGAESVPTMFRMDSAFRERVRLTIATALAVAPRSVKKAFADQFDAQQQEASRKLSQAVAEAVLQVYEVVEKPLPPPG